MPKGPILNDISRSFTTRDSLGIEGVATTIQASICPIINKQFAVSREIQSITNTIEKGMFLSPDMSLKNTVKSLDSTFMDLLNAKRL